MSYNNIARKPFYNICTEAEFLDIIGIKVLSVFLSKLSRLSPETSMKMYVNEFGFCSALLNTIVESYVLFVHVKVR